MKIVPYKKRKNIEIYFVLYLAALILLIPGKESDKTPHTDEFGSPLFQLDFIVKAEKASMNFLISMDSSGMKLVSADSINTVFYTGNVENVRYEFIVEDLLHRNKLVLTSNENNSTKFFKVINDDKEQAAKFFWYPSLSDMSNKSYLVNVIATAVGKSGKNKGSELKSVTQFALNITFSNQKNDYLVLQNMQNDSMLTNIEQPANTNSQLIVQTGNIIMLPQQDVIRTIAYGRWQNIINVNGLNPKTDLLRQPVLTVMKTAEDDRAGTAYIKGYSEDWITIEGIAPSYGSMKVKLQLTRKYDSQEKSIEFMIENQRLGEPKFANVIYPGINYKIEPNLPLLTMQSTKAILRTSDGKSVLYSSNEGAPFWFSPSTNDTGKILELIRYIDNNQVGQKYSIKVSGYPLPLITKVAEIEKNNKLRIFTTSYGIYNNDENIVTRLEVLEGNIKVREIIGLKSTDSNKNQHQQVFEITNVNNNPLVFKIRAVTINGSKSSILDYP